MSPIISTFSNNWTGAGGSPVQNIIRDLAVDYTSVDHNGVMMYYGNHSIHDKGSFRFTVDPGTIYVAMLGASGATQNYSYRSGQGGIGIIELTFTSTTTCWILMSKGGVYGQYTMFNTPSTATYYGGASGRGNFASGNNANYHKGAGGGGLTGIFATNSSTEPYFNSSSATTLIACVGSGGGAGGASSGGDGGGLNRNGLNGCDVNNRSTSNTRDGRGGTTTAGGAKGSISPFNGSGHTDGSLLYGGTGCNSDWDLGAGGGAGFYGGGGGSSGGGYSSGGGGGGSGKNNAGNISGVTGSVDLAYVGDGDTNNSDPNAAITNYIQTLSGKSLTIGSYGKSPNLSDTNGRSGWACVWTKQT